MIGGKFFCEVYDDIIVGSIRIMVYFIFISYMFMYFMCVYYVILKEYNGEDGDEIYICSCEWFNVFVKVLCILRLIYYLILFILMLLLNFLLLG